MHRYIRSITWFFVKWKNVQWTFLEAYLDYSFSPQSMFVENYETLHKQQEAFIKMYTLS